MTRVLGPEAWLEGALNVGGGFSAFGRGFLRPGDAGAMAGVRYAFDW